MQLGKRMTSIYKFVPFTLCYGYIYCPLYFPKYFPKRKCQIQRSDRPVGIHIKLEKFTMQLHRNGHKILLTGSDSKRDFAPKLAHGQLPNFIPEETDFKWKIRARYRIFMEIYEPIKPWLHKKLYFIIYYLLTYAIFTCIFCLI